MKRFALLALLASPLPAQSVPFPGGTLHGIVSVIDWNGAPAIVLFAAPMGGNPAFLSYQSWPIPPVSWRFEVVAGAVFDSRPCAQTWAARCDPYAWGECSPQIGPCSDEPGSPIARIGPSGFAVATWPRMRGTWLEPHVPLYPHSLSCGGSAFWTVGYCNARCSSGVPCSGTGFGPEFFALVMRVVVK